MPDGRTAFVPWTLPDEEVRVRVVESRKRWVRAVPEDLVRPAMGRVEPPCPHFGTCGGCRLQHMPEGEQRRWKGVFVREALSRIGGLPLDEDVPVAPSAEQFGYRSRVTFTVAHRGGRLHAGLKEAGRPGRVVDIDRCLLADPAIQETWTGLRQLLQKAGTIPPGTVARVTLRAVEEGVIMLWTPRCPAPDGEFFAQLPGMIQVWESGASGSRRLWGDTEGHETWFGRRVKVPGPAFTQVNRASGQRLFDAVVEAAGDVEGLKVVDAYGGLSPVGTELADQGGSVTVVEMDERATASLAEDGGVAVLWGRVEALLPEALPADLVILNPPRSGLHEETVVHLLAEPPARILYVSCDPATLARDVKRLSLRYEMGRVHAFDLFPQTPHVEVLVDLRVRDPDIGQAAE